MIVNETLDLKDEAMRMDQARVEREQRRAENGNGS